jgi:hypothetical protein
MLCAMRSHRIAALLAGLALVAAAPAGASAADRLPDLGMARLQDFRIDKSGGKRLLRYSAIIVNTGVGPFQAKGTRSASTGDMSVVQQVFQGDGTFRDLPTTAAMYFAGDGHTHWHVRDLESSLLERSDNGVKVGTGAKHGFCFFDNVPFALALPGAPGAASYTTCGTNPSALTQTMGLSVGWGDAYYYYLTDQWIDITNVSPGRFRLTTTADPTNWFLESNDFNNFTWVDLQIKSNGPPRVLAYGPSA